MPENKEPELTCENKEAIRSYLLRLFTLPAIAVSVLSFVIGLAINEGAAGRATADALKDVLPKVTAASDAAHDASATAERAKISAQTTLSEAEQIAGRLKQLKELQQVLEQAGALEKNVAEALAKDAQFNQKIAAAALKDASSFVRYGDKLALECEQHPGLHLHAGSGRNVTVEVNALSSPFVRWSIQPVPPK